MMHARLMALTFFLIVLSISLPVHADLTWQKTAGPEGGFVLTFVIDPHNNKTVFAGTGYGGVFKSTNGGESWSSVSTDLMSVWINALAIDPVNSQTIYAGTSSGVFVSTNGGESWSAVNTGLTFLWINALAVDPVNSQTIYVGTSNGVFVSTNGGKSWSAVNTGLTSLRVNALAIDPVNSKTLYAGTANGVYKSTNSGASWSHVSSDTPSLHIYTLVIDPNNSQTLYIGTFGYGVFKTTNGGESWSNVTSGMQYTFIHVLALDPNNSQIVYAGVDDREILKSTDGGNTWTDFNTGMQVRAIAVDPTNGKNVYAGTNGAGIFRTTNDGRSWKSANRGLTASHITALVLDPDLNGTVYAGTYGGGVFKTTNGGNSWAAVNSGLWDPVVYSLVIDPTDGKTLYAATSECFFKTTNGGKSWTALVDAVVASSLAIDSSGQTLYAGIDGAGVSKSTDGGNSWREVNTELNNLYVHSLAVAKSDSQTLYAGTSGGVYKTGNGGTYNWNLANAGLPPFSGLGVFAIDPTDRDTVFYRLGNWGLYRTTDGGGYWQDIGAGLPWTNDTPALDTTATALAIHPTIHRTMYTGTSNGVFMSIDGGDTWNPANGGMTSARVSSFAIDPTISSSPIIYAGTEGGGVFKTVTYWWDVKPSTVHASYKGDHGTVTFVVFTNASTATVTPTSSAPWLTVSGPVTVSPKKGEGSGTVQWAAGANPSSSARTATITIGTKRITVTQDPALCVVKLTPANLSVGAAGGAATVGVTAPEACGWSVSSQTAPWITPAPLSGSGSGAISLDVAANETGKSHNGKITVATSVKSTAVTVRQGK